MSAIIEDSFLHRNSVRTVGVEEGVHVLLSMGV